MEISFDEIKTGLKQIENYYSEPDNWNSTGLNQLKYISNEIKKMQSYLEYLNLIKILENLIERIEKSRIGYTEYEKEIEKINKNLEKFK